MRAALAFNHGVGTAIVRAGVGVVAGHRRFDAHTRLAKFGGARVAVGALQRRGLVAAADGLVARVDGADVAVVAWVGAFGSALTGDSLQAATSRQAKAAVRNRGRSAPTANLRRSF